MSFFKKSDVKEVPSEIIEDCENAVFQFPELSEDPGLELSSSIENDDKSQEESKVMVTASTDGQNPKNTYKQEEIFPVDDDVNEDQNKPILWMRKEKIKKKEDVCPIFDEEKRSELEKLGFRPVKQYNNKVKEKVTIYNTTLRRWHIIQRTCFNLFIYITNLLRHFCLRFVYIRQTFLNCFQEII